ncbi:hypothetical protein IR083_00015 [Dysgonomonas sp. GY75]|uniref:hypothetical protein n=1 Tax=Dysgonomonas sp. GY75 TaxID=2780419 RepID=UPI001883EE7C|nr:hypothetical protein [Dysgonomonas sp. GY75]MBF0647206.1 hypothetical protein [Dysgonomonas sp. GY75]
MKLQKISKIIGWIKDNDFISQNRMKMTGTIMVLVLIIIPQCTWVKDLDFDYVKLTEEWYKILLGYLVIGILIMLFYDQNKENKKRHMLKKRDQLIKKIKADNDSYEKRIMDFQKFEAITEEINILFGNEYLNEKERFARAEMLHYLEKCTNENESDYRTTLNNIISKL